MERERVTPTVCHCCLAFSSALLCWLAVECASHWPMWRMLRTLQLAESSLETERGPQLASSRYLSLSSLSFVAILRVREQSDLRDLRGVLQSDVVNCHSMMSSTWRM